MIKNQKPKPEPKLILQRVDTGLFVDGFDGERYEWTRDRKRAWRMGFNEASRRRKQLIGMGFNVSFQKP